MEISSQFLLNINVLRHVLAVIGEIRLIIFVKQPVLQDTMEINSILIGHVSHNVHHHITVSIE